MKNFIIYFVCVGFLLSGCSSAVGPHPPPMPDEVPIADAGPGDQSVTFDAAFLR